MVAAIIGAALFLAVVGAILCIRREPVYGGRTLSEWICRREAGNPEAIEAIRRIGTNSFPVVLAWVSQHPRWYDKNVSDWIGKLPSGMIPEGLRKWAVSGPAKARMRNVQVVLEILQVEADAIAPQLLTLTYRKPAGVGKEAVEALASMGTNGLPYLLEAVGHMNHPFRCELIHGISTVLTTNPGNTMIAGYLSILTGDPDPQIRNCASLELASWASSSYTPDSEFREKIVERMENDRVAAAGRSRP
jgi:hypothetical protein